LDEYTQNPNDASREIVLRAEISRALAASPVVAEQVRRLLDNEMTPPKDTTASSVSNKVADSFVDGSIIQAARIDKIIFRE
jgi:mRNA-degrading endonuclease toxin of MazEF toxin-antitoxin module